MYEVPDDFAIIKLGELALLSTFCSENTQPRVERVVELTVDSMGYMGYWGMY
jgi:hypothetical protein